MTKGSTARSRSHVTRTCFTSCSLVWFLAHLRLSIRIRGLHLRLGRPLLTRSAHPRSIPPPLEVSPGSVPGRSQTRNTSPRVSTDSAAAICATYQIAPTTWLGPFVIGYFGLHLSVVVQKSSQHGDVAKYITRLEPRPSLTYAALRIHVDLARFRDNAGLSPHGYNSLGG